MCCSMLPSQTKNVTVSSFLSPLPLLLFSSSLSVSTQCNELIHGHHFLSPQQRCRKSNILCCSGSQLLNRCDIAILRFLLHSIPIIHVSPTQMLPTARADPSLLDNTVIFLQTCLGLGQGWSLHYKRKIHKKIET